jgi:hypothetical protein
MVDRCRELAPDCTEQELVYFIREKAALMENRKGSVYNPLGFLLTAVPRCFAPESLSQYRQRAAQGREDNAQSESREQAAMERWRREQEASLSDPNLSEQEKHLIRLCLGLNTGQPGDRPPAAKGNTHPAPLRSGRPDAQPKE